MLTSRVMYYTRVSLHKPTISDTPWLPVAKTFPKTSPLTETNWTRERKDKVCTINSPMCTVRPTTLLLCLVDLNMGDEKCVYIKAFHLQPEICHPTTLSDEGPTNNHAHTNILLDAYFILHCRVSSIIYTIQWHHAMDNWVPQHCSLHSSTSQARMWLISLAIVPVHWSGVT
jgi:hypothetical protein